MTRWYFLTVMLVCFALANLRPPLDMSILVLRLIVFAALCYLAGVHPEES